MTGENINIRPGAPEDLPGRPQQDRSTGGWSYRPRIDITEDADGFIIIADIPGAATDGIRLSFENRTLTIHGTVQPRQVRETEYLAQEYGIGDFDRALAMSDAVDADRINAEYEHGVLTIHLPKTEQAKPRRIPVRAA